MRDGLKTEVPVNDVVVGDIAILSTGDKVGADMRIVYSMGLKLDQSMLTGEVDPQTKAIDDTEKNALESKCLAFSGSLCVEGQGVGIVIRTGAHTLIGSLASLTTGEDSPSTLQIEILRFVQIVTVLSLFTGMVVFIVGMSTGKTFMESFMFGFLVVIVANVPQGLPATVRSYSQL
jgi:sodium/potassium-transporting ATPase subunit alpha